jgi:hypothetical protein
MNAKGFQEKPLQYELAGLPEGRDRSAQTSEWLNGR